MYMSLSNTLLFDFTYFKIDKNGVTPYAFFCDKVTSSLTTVLRVSHADAYDFNSCIFIAT